MSLELEDIVIITDPKSRHFMKPGYVWEVDGIRATVKPIVEGSIFGIYDTFTLQKVTAPKSILLIKLKESYK